MDSKTPGLPEQLLQYKNQTHECRATHQTRYGSPGVFPVVHLLKKNMPVRTITPNKVTSHLALQESPPRYTMEYTNAVEDITQDGISCGNQSNLSSQNVLDALKEISRKRIHSEDQILHPNSSKRQRSECYTDSTTEFSSSGNNTANRMLYVTEVPSIINAITASLTSSHAYKVHPRRSIKKTTQYAEEENRKQKNVETQTDNLLERKIKKPSSNTTISSAEDKLVENTNICEKSTILSPSGITKLFNETPYDVVKKNKLVTLLSPLTSTEAQLLPSHHELIKTDTNTNQLLHPQIKPASIISPKNKPKHNKHVTFVIPEKENTKDMRTSKSNDCDLVLNADANKTECENRLQSIITTQVFDKEKRESDSHLKNESNSDKENLTNFSKGVLSENQFLKTTPSIYPAVEMRCNNQQQTPLIMTNKLTTNNGLGSEIASAGRIMPSSTATSTKVGGFKFDFKNSETVQSKTGGSLLPSVSDSSVKSRLSSVKFNITDHSGFGITRPILTNMPMFSTNSTASSACGLAANANSEVTNTHSDDKGSFQPSSYVHASSSIQLLNKNTVAYNPATSAKFRSSSQFGANTTVTSAFGANMLLSTGLGTSNAVTTIALPISSSTYCDTAVNSPSSLNPPISNFDTSRTQTFGSNFGFNTNKSSVLPTSPNVSSTGFGVPDFLSTTPKPMFSFSTSSNTGYSISTTKISTNNNNAGTQPISSVFGSALNLPLNNSKTGELLTTNNVTGLNSGNSFNSSVFAGDSKTATLKESIVKPNAFNTVINNNIFGAIKNNLNPSNFIGNAFESPPQTNLLFNSSAVTIPSQLETFTTGTSNVPLSNTPIDIFSLAREHDVSRTGKLNLLSTSNVSSSFNTTTNSLFGSVATTTFGSSANPFCLATNSGFNTTTYNNVVTPKFDSTASRIFSIGSGTSYPKSRAQLRGRRRT